MGLFSLEHGRLAYLADFATYAIASLCLLFALVLQTPPGHWPSAAILVAAGGLFWTLAEYLIHRFVFHALPPFRHWHAAHHRRPRALIGTPTVLSAALFLVLILLPSLRLFSAWIACALTLGVVSGYLAYGSVHHAVHHGASRNAWFRRRQQEHALHHRLRQRAVHFGVTTGVWDVLLGTSLRAPPGSGEPHGSGRTSLSGALTSPGTSASLAPVR